MTTYHEYLHPGLATEQLNQLLDSTPMRISSQDKSLLLDARLGGNPTQCLVDSGCTALGFVDLEYAQQNSLKQYHLLQPRPLTLADGGTSSQITHFTIQRLTFGDHEETIPLYITKLQHANPVILGYPWLQLHNPAIDWAAGSLEFNATCCQHRCLKIRTIQPHPANNPSPKPSLASEHPPASGIGGSRRRTGRTPQRPAPKPQNTYTGPETTSIEEIRLLISAPNFLHSLKEEGTTVHRLTLRQIEEGAEPPPDPSLPNLTEPEFQALLNAEGDIEHWRTKLDPAYHDFLNSIYDTQSAVLNKITEEDVDKFMKGKDSPTIEELQKLVPPEYHAFLDLFQRQNADELAPHRPFDHAIDIMPGKRATTPQVPPLQPNRTQSHPKMA